MKVEILLVSYRSISTESETPELHYADVEQLAGSPDCRSGPSGLGVRVPPAAQNKTT
jgi:hypothetical protein